MGTVAKIARRTFLVGAVAVAGGVAFGTYAYRRTPENPLLADLPEGGAALTPFVLLDADGVTLITPRADVGQGATSVQTYLLAEELDVDPMTVRTSPGPASPVYYNGKLAAEGMPLAAWDTGLLARTGRAASDVAGKLLGLHGTGGSTTVPDMYDRLREAGAAARETLKAAAAARLGVAADSLRTEAGAVVPPDGAPIPYAALIPDLARVEVVQDVPLRAPEDWRWLGREMQRTDIVAKSTGTFRYGTDLVLPEMVHATVRTNPARGGGVVQMDDAAARAQPGVIDILEIEDGVAVVADNTWRAIKAANLIDVTWGTPEGVGDSAAMWAAHGAAFTADKQDSRFADDGDVDAAPGTPLEAEYRVPYLHHAPLEPANATVRFTPEATEVWAATQIPTMVVDQIADVTGQSADQITLHALPAGGSFGHRLEFEWIVQATQIAMHVPGRPVRLTLSREQDMTHGFLRPMAMARGRGTVEGGQVRAFDLSIAAQSVSASQMGRMGFPAAGPDVAIVAAAWDAPYAVPDRRVTGYRVDPMVGVSSWRAVGASHNGFFHETLMDELIHAAGADPVAERVRLLHHGPTKAVLEAVAEMAAWDGPTPAPGVGRGVAVTFAFGVPVAQILEVRDTEDGIKLENLWIAAELGRVLDPVNAEAQLSGGALFGISHAIASEITFADHAIEQANFDTYENARLWQMPQVHVRAMGTTDAIRGAGEPGLPAASAALGNAIFAATGTRLRQMPFAREMRFA